MIKERIKSMKYGPLLINYKRIIMQRVNSRLYDDETAVKRMYRKRLGRELNLDNPERFTEKLQWEKLYYRNPVMTTCVDKIAVRDYLMKKGYGEYLMPVVGIFRSPDEINVKELPEKCILKASHGSSMHLVKQSNDVDWKLWKRIMRSWMKMNIYIEGREWPYKDVPAGIICEEFVEAKTENKLKDYKLFCFEGEPEFIQVDLELLKDHHINFYDSEWNLLPIRCQYPNSDAKVSKPINFEKMKEIARNLSKEFPHVRVDFYEYDDQLRIGELTFFDGSGFYSFKPDNYDFIFGGKMMLEKFEGGGITFIAVYLKVVEYQQIIIR